MKKILIIFTITIAGVSLTGCKDFLDVKTQNAYTSDNFFTTDQQSIDAVEALTTDFCEEDGYSGSLHWDQCATDMYTAGRPAGNAWIPNFHLEYAGDVADMPSMFSRIYRNISRANWIVNELLKKENNQGLSVIENRSLGEAYFYRAMWHYLAAYRHGCGTRGVPFIAYEKYGAEYDYSIPPQLETVMDNYAAIISDFEDARARLPKISEYSSADLGRPQQEACLAMESRIYAYWATWDKSQWKNVITTVNNLEQMGRTLAPTYNILFTDEPTQYFSQEYCWGIGAVGTGGQGTSFWFERFIINSMIVPQIDGWGEFFTSKDLYDEFLADGEGNERLTRCILRTGEQMQLFGEPYTLQYLYGDAIPSGYFVHKWDDAFSHPNGEGVYWKGRTSNMMFHIIRFADCKLLRAEANMALSDGDKTAALRDINDVRQRSHLAPITVLTWEALYHERKCELAFEGNDYCHDCKRWAVSGDPVIKALAIDELESHPNVTLFEKNAQGVWEDHGTIPYPRYIPVTPVVWQDYKIALPYPTIEITKSNGKLVQPTGY